MFPSENNDNYIIKLSLYFMLQIGSIANMAINYTTKWVSQINGRNCYAKFVFFF